MAAEFAVGLRLFGSRPRSCSALCSRSETRDESDSLILAATNHPALLDRALFRRFDSVIDYQLPTAQLAGQVIERLSDRRIDSVSPLKESLE
jgi:AAA+ superfamily predicted ATPase